MSKDIKVGLFVLFGLTLGGLVVFMIGNERRFFETSEVYHAEFKDVQGLSKGAPVQMGGVRVGQVTEVTYGEEATDRTIYVTLEIVEVDARRLRKDAEAQIVNKGLLGDKMILVSMGTAAEALPPGGVLRSAEPDDFMSKVGQMAEKADGALDDVSQVAQSLANEDLHRDIRESAHSLNILLTQVSKGDGYAHRFLADPNEADRISATIDNLNQTSAELNATLRELHASLRQVRTGPGFAHDLIYGDGLAPEVAQVGHAAEEVALTLQGIREGNGFAHDVIYGGKGDTQDAVKNVTQLTADLRDIVRGVKDGKGTVGALLVDPSIYEDLKRVLGNVERNSVLRALVRYSIKRDEAAPKVDVVAKEP